jgi:UDP-2-acetamido-2,6-beta-L-arabino-hexul-4-ose reductase
MNDSPVTRIGITGQSGFIGTHLTNTLNLYRNEFFVVPFKDEYFEDENVLKKFVQQCDVIVHLAAINRHEDQQYLYDKNIELGDKLINAIIAEKTSPHVIFSSSIQEELNNIYGNAKKQVRTNFEKLASENGSNFTGLIIPNVFGPFSNPFYNTVVATFCHQLINNISPKIITDSEVSLIYVGELVNNMLEVIRRQGSKKIISIRIEPTIRIKVSEILHRLETFKYNYLRSGIIPEIKNRFELHLFNTFRSFIDYAEFFPVKYKLNTDERGTFVETMKVGVGGQVSYSTTIPGITRGNHFHTRKIERFAVIKGEALIQLRKIGTKEIINLNLSGSEPAYVDMPIWYTHNIKNVGNEELLTMFWINEFYNQDDPDTFFEKI